MGVIQLTILPYNCYLQTIMSVNHSRLFSSPLPCAAIVWVLWALVIGLGPIHQVVMRFIPDDGYYYLEIARRIGIGEGSTFDGITATNGYHPLWVMCLLPLAQLMTASREAGLRMAILLGVGLIGGAFLLLNILSGIRNSTRRWLFLFLPMSMLLVSSNYGMESPLVLFLLALWLVILQLFVNTMASDRGNSKQTLIFPAAMGILSASLILARLDMIVFVFCFDLFYAYKILSPLIRPTDKYPAGLPPGRSLGPLFLCAAIQMIVIGAYLSYNYNIYGHILTVSALVKSGRGDSSLFSWLWASWGALPGVASGFLALAAWLHNPSKKGDPVLAIAASGTILCLLIIASTSRGEAYHWYFTGPIFLSGLFLDSWLSRCKTPGHSPYAKPVFFLLILGMFALSVYRRAWHPEHRQPNRHYLPAKWIAQHAPADAVFALPDCGLKAYFSERPHVNTDGLTCSFEFQESLRNGTAADFLNSAGVNMMYSQEPLTDSVLLPIRKGMYGIAPPVQASVRLFLQEDHTNYLWKITSIQPAP